MIATKLVLGRCFKHAIDMMVGCIILYRPGSSNGILTAIDTMLNLSFYLRIFKITSKGRLIELNVMHIYKYGVRVTVHWKDIKEK